MKRILTWRKAALIALVLMWVGLAIPVVAKSDDRAVSEERCTQRDGDSHDGGACRGER